MRSQISLVGATVLVAACGSALPYALKGTGEAAPTPAPIITMDTGASAYISAFTAAAPAAPPAAGARSGRALLVESALDALAGQVSQRSHPDALLYAFQAYFSYRAAHPEQVRKPYLYFVDYGLDSRTPRGYVFNMETLTVVDGPFTVAHGRGSAGARDGAPVRFSNREGSAATSLGLYLAQETYQFRGTAGGSRYRSVGLRMQGLSGRFNNAARRRGVVVHGAPYVTASRAGRSEGCPAMEQARAERLIPMISNGGLVYHFSARDVDWMREDPWSQGAGEVVIPSMAAD